MCHTWESSGFLFVFVSLCALRPRVTSRGFTRRRRFGSSAGSQAQTLLSGWECTELDRWGLVVSITLRSPEALTQALVSVLPLEDRLLVAERRASSQLHGPDGPHAGRKQSLRGPAADKYKPR